MSDHDLYSTVVVRSASAPIRLGDALLGGEISGASTGNLLEDYATLEAERDKLAKVLEDVEREHDLIRRMKNCEIRRSRGSFGIAVMGDPPALEWQALDKELQQFVDARRAILATGTEQEVEK